MASLGVSSAIAQDSPAPASAPATATDAAATPDAATPAASDVEPEALQALQRMGDYLGTLNAFEIKAVTSLDLVTADGQRIQIDGTANYKVRRPAGFVISVDSDVKKRTFFYDGKAFTVFAPELHYYATAPAPSTNMQTLDKLEDKFGISLPVEDLFRWSDPSLKRSDELKSGFPVGTATIDGVKTDQYAFREGDIDWQIWIQHDGQPLPRKLVIIDRTDPANPTYTTLLTWNVTPTLTTDDFTFRPGKDDKLIRLSAGQ
jgi:hypothetical protein